MEKPPAFDGDYQKRRDAYHAHLRNWRNWPKDELAAYIKATGSHPKYFTKMRPREFVALPLAALIVAPFFIYGFVVDRGFRKEMLEPITRRLWKRS